MCAPLAIPIAMAAIAAVSKFSESQQQQTQQKYQAELTRYDGDVANNNAIAMRQQADIDIQRGEMAQRGIDNERDKLRRGYEAEAGTNRSLLAAGNVDITSGSAADSLLGNAMLFSEDYAANRYNHAVAGWDAAEQARISQFKASQFDAQRDASYSQASWLKKSAGGIGNSLLSAGIAGGSAFMSGYGMMGGNMFGSTPSAGSWSIAKNPITSGSSTFAGTWAEPVKDWK